MATDNLAPDHLAPGQYGTNIIKTDNLALGQFGTNIKKTDNLAPRKKRHLNYSLTI